jgi:hypothetical protein
MNFPKWLEDARTLADVFEIVKRAAAEDIGWARGGLMLALADLGNHPQGFLGAFYPVATNVIVMNKVPLARIRETDPDLYKPYAFHVLLHEYLHAVGFLDEGRCRQRAYEISRNLFGEAHVVTRIAKDFRPFFPNLVYPEVAWRPGPLELEFVEGFDRGNATYFA